MAALSAQSPLRVCVVTGARSEYGLMRWVMEGIRAHAHMRLQIIATASHLSEQHGFTYREIEADGLAIDAKVPVALDSGSPLALACAVGRLTGDLAEALTALQPDLVMFMGDRYELLAVISACVLLTLPMAHLSGGEVTEGAIDEQIRHAATKAAHLHCVANETYGARVRRMGEETWRVCVSGEPGLDALHRLPRMSRQELAVDLGISPEGPIGLVTYQPETLLGDGAQAALNAVLEALDTAYHRDGMRYVMTYPNADAGSSAIIAAFEAFITDHPGCALVKSLGHRRYLSALAALDFMLGNSSSGLFEAPSFAMPVVNVGDRQAGRMRAVNVIDVAARSADILRGMASALAFDRSQTVVNPYGDGNASARVVAFIDEVFRTRTRDQILRKRFADQS